MNYIENKSLGEGYYEIDHKSGLKIYVYPKKDYRSVYAVFGTKYGSIDTQFKIDSGDFIRVPEGIAHFLEHKLFESEEGDAFSRYAKTGASANAFTSFDKTCYLFTASDNIDESLEILLDFVQHPYFTEQTVQKEQGIIGQEIKMYDDNPGWKVYFNLLECLYHNHPVKTEIAGTVESIAKIDAKLLYDCYNTFYNLHNMTLAVCGNITVEQVIKAADKLLIDAQPINIERSFDAEPDEIVCDNKRQGLAIAVPVFMLGYKEKLDGEFCDEKKCVCMDMLLDLIAGKTSPLYKKLLEDGLVNESFGCEFDIGRSFAVSVFSGESEHPEQVADKIKEEIANYRKNGVDKEQFEKIKRKHYGLAIKEFNNIEEIGNSLVSAHFSDTGIYTELDIIKNLTVDDINACFDEFLLEGRCALSIIDPA